MTSNSHVSESDLLRSQVADLSRELAERDHALGEQSAMFRAILVSTAAEIGNDFFSALVRQLTSVLGVQYALIGEVKQDVIMKVRTVAVSSGGVLIDNFEYPLADTPCASVLGHSVACFEREAGTAFPAFERLAQLSVEGYCGIAIRDKGGAAMGLLAVMDTKPLRKTECLRSLLTVFASRAGAELERQKAEMELRQHQRRLIEAQALAHLGSWDWDIDSGTVQWSAEQFRIFGYEPGTFSVTYDTFLTSLHPDDHDRVLASINDALLGKRPTDLEYRIVRPNGEIRTVHGRGDVFRDNIGHPIRMAGICLDITDRKLTEEERLRQFSFLDHVPNVAFLKGSSGRYLYTNRRFEEAFGLAPGGALGKTDDELFSSQQALQFRTHDQLVLASGQAHEFEEMAQHKDGTHANIVVKFPLNNDESGLPTAIVGIAMDITQRERTQKQLRLYREIFARSIDGIAVIDLKGQYLEQNAAHERMLGHSLDHLAGSTPAIHLGEETFARIGQELATKGIYRGEVQSRTASGEPLVIDLAAFAVKDTKGSPMCYVGIKRDITERKQTEQALRERDALTRSFLDNSATIAWMKNAEGRYVYISPSLERRFHTRSENWIGKTDFELWPPEIAESLRRNDLVVLSENRVIETVEEVENPDGSRSWWLSHKFPFQDASGQRYAGGLGVDITERKQIEAALRESEARYLSLIEAIPQQVWTARPDGTLDYVNRRVLDYFDCQPDDLLGWEWQSVLHPDDLPACLASWSNALRTGEPYEIEFRLRRAFDGAYRWHLARALPVKDTSNRILKWFGANTDITDRKRVEQSLRQREQELQTVLREREHISEDLHDGILQSLYAVGLGLESCKPLMRQRKHEQATVLLEHAIGQLNHVMTEVRNFIAGLESQVLQGGDFAAALQTMVQILSASAATVCRVSIEEAAARQLSTEQALHVMNVVREALSNSLRHSRAKRITVSLKPLAEVIRLSVVDNGVGFRPAAAQGVGHGLTNMVARARKIGGRFAVRSKPRKGTKILLDLPKVTMSAHH